LAEAGRCTARVRAAEAAWLAASSDGNLREWTLGLSQPPAELGKQWRERLLAGGELHGLSDMPLHLLDVVCGIPLGAVAARAQAIIHAREAGLGRNND
jgi:hypothetical protein